MASAARAAASRPLLKIKLGGAQGDPERIAAVRAAAPQSELIVDANEGWTAGNLAENLAACAERRRHAGRAAAAGRQRCRARDDPAPDRGLRRRKRARPRDACARWSGRYDAVNIKLDKTGGLTEALAMAEEAARLGLQIMTGCMVATSLAMAPAVLVAQRAKVVDLDGPLLLAKDRPDGLRYDGSLVHPPTPALWG